MSKDKCYSCSFGSRCKSNKLVGRGQKTADIMLVMEAPELWDDNGGQILKGDGGKGLFYYLEKTGIPRSKVYVTNAIKCKPTVKPAEIKDKKDKLNKDKTEIEVHGDKPISMCKSSPSKRDKRN